MTRIADLGNLWCWEKARSIFRKDFQTIILSKIFAVRTYCGFLSRRKTRLTCAQLRCNVCLKTFSPRLKNVILIYKIFLRRLNLIISFRVLRLRPNSFGSKESVHKAFGPPKAFGQASSSASSASSLLNKVCNARSGKIYNFGQKREEHDRQIWPASFVFSPSLFQ